MRKSSKFIVNQIEMIFYIARLRHGHRGFNSKSKVSEIVFLIDSDSSDEDDKEWDDIGQNIIEKFSEPNPSMSSFINLTYFR